MERRLLADPIQGYRPGTERTPSKVYSTRHLELKPTAANAQAALYKEVWSAMDAYAVGRGEPVPCVLDPEPFTNDDVPDLTDREAQMMCAGCPLAVKRACGIYAEVSNPAWAVHAGMVYGRGLATAMREEDENGRG